MADGKKTRRQRRYKMWIVIEEKAQPWFAPTEKLSHFVLLVWLSFDAGSWKYNSA